MTQNQFYDSISHLGLRDDQQTFHQRLVKDLRDKNFSWKQISTIFECLESNFEFSIPALA